MPKEYLAYEELISQGERQGLLKLSENKVEYNLAKRKSYKLTDPEERVRASFCIELVKRYQYPKERIDIEVEVPRREPKDKADIVIYEDDELKRPYIVCECKPDGISPGEIKQAVEQAFGNAHSLGAKYATVVAGNVRVAFDVAGFPPMEREKNIIADIPIRYGKLIKFKYKKGDADWDLREVDRSEILAKFQQCHDTLWEAGKRNPAEAFDEMSKLMFCKIHDERFLTKKDQYYRFQVGTHEEITEVAERVKNIYKNAQRIDPDVFVDTIKAENPIIYGVVEILQGISLSQTDLDAKGVAFEHFLGAVFRGEMGQYFTPRPIVEFMVEMLSPDENDFVIDPACGSGGFLLYALDKVKRELEESLSPRDADYRWRDFGLKQLFGIEINSQLARVAMINMIIHEDGHSNIENNDGLGSPEKFNPRRDIKLGQYTFLLTNPPFGAVTKEREKPYLSEYELGGKIRKRRRQNTEILFIERSLDFLAPGGRMGIVLPDGILTNSSLQYVRDFITDKAQILAVVSLPQTSFVHYGSGVKASLLFLRKKKEGEKIPDDYPIFMAIAEHIGYGATGRPDRNELPALLGAYRRHTAGERQIFPDAPLCFSTEWGVFGQRFDASYHKPEFRDALSRIRATKYEIKSLKELADKIFNFGAYSLCNYIKFVDHGIPFLRVQDIQEDGIDRKNLKSITKEVHDILHKSKVKKGDVIFSMAGSIGLATVVSSNFDNCNSNQALAKIRLKANVNPYYISSFLNTSLGRLQSSRIASGGVQSNINLGEIGTIEVPLPPCEIQDKIADLMDEAYKIKKEKEAEAERLLNSIEDYVLGELGIEVPEIREEKHFAVSLGKIKGKRLDPHYFQPKFEILETTILAGRYATKTYGQLLISIVNGVDERKFTERGTPYLRVSNIRPNEIDENNIKFISIPLEHVMKDVKLNCGDVLFTRKGTFGVTAVVREETHHLISSEIMRLRLTNEVTPDYFSIVNNTIIIQDQCKQKSVGAMMGSLDQDAVRRLRIPLPPLGIQESIANEVQVRRDRAKLLKEEASQALKQAKEKIERMILGK